MQEVRFIDDSKQNQKRACPSCCDEAAAAAATAVDASNHTSNPSSSGTGILCSACVRAALQRAHERHESAKTDWVAARQKCADHFQQQQQHGCCPSIMAELQDRSQSLLREELERLRQECADAAMKACAMQLRAQERQQQLHEHAEVPVAVNREMLHRLNRSIICDPTNNPDGATAAGGAACACAGAGALVQAITTAQTTVRTLRFQWALQAFQMHRLQVEEGYADRPTTNKQTEWRKGARRNFVSGIGKIGGLPLPHAGPELYGVLPAEELQSALRLVAQLTSLTARCLGILLPHPILLQLPSSSANNGVASSRFDEGDIANLAFSGTREGAMNDPANKQDSSLASSISSALQGQASSFLGEPSSMTARLSMDPQKVQQRVRHAISAVIAEDQSHNCSTYYALAAENINQDEFAIALQLLQNNIIALCIRAGVPVAKLWPGEAVLLNLHALNIYSETQVQVVGCALIPKVSTMSSTNNPGC